MKSHRDIKRWSWWLLRLGNCEICDESMCCSHFHALWLHMHRSFTNLLLQRYIYVCLLIFKSSSLHRLEIYNFSHARTKQTFVLNKNASNEPNFIKIGSEITILNKYRLKYVYIAALSWCDRFLNYKIINFNA